MNIVKWWYRCRHNLYDKIGVSNKLFPYLTSEEQDKVQKYYDKGEDKMNEQATGRCQHGEFNLRTGCPQCVAERQADAEVNSPDNIAKRIGEAEEAAAGKEVPPFIVKVRYYSETTGQISDREYSYFSIDPLKVGDIVRVSMRDTEATAKVTAVNIPESEIESFRGRVKTIPAGSKLTDQGPPTQAAEEPEQLQARLTLSEDVSEEAKEAAAALEDITGGQIKVQAINSEDQQAAEFLTEQLEEAIPEIMEATVKEVASEPPVNFGQSISPLVDAKPPALAVIETQVGRSFSGLFQLYQEAAGLLRVAKKRVITTNEDLKPATDDLATIAVCKKAMFSRKAEVVRPFKARLDAINQAFDDLMFPILEADRLTRNQVSTFDSEQRRKAAEAARIEAEKLKLAKEEAALSETGEHTQALGTAEAPPPVPEHTRTDLGTLGGRTNWKARVLDFSQLPDEYKLPNEPLLNSFARSTKGTRPIPGVEFYDDRVPTMRTK